MKPVMYIACLASLLFSAQASASPANHELLSFIRHYEAGGQYSAVYSGLKRKPPKPLTAMSVGEVLAWQKSLGKVTSTAVGGYQFIHGTLNQLVRANKIDNSRLFDAALQDELARLLIHRCEPKQKAGDTVAFANCLAGIWAALPLVSGPNKGKSRYHGIAGNKARTTPQNVLAFLSGNGQHKPANEQITQKVPAPPTRLDKIRAAMVVAQETNTLGGSILKPTYQEQNP